MRRFVRRMIRAAMLNVRTYEEVEADKGAMGQAMGVVVLSSLAGGIGFLQEAGPLGMLIGIVGSLFGWFVWAFLTYEKLRQIYFQQIDRVSHFYP